MTALEALTLVVAKGLFGPWHLPQIQSTGDNIYFGPASKPKAGPMDPLGPQSEGDSLSGFRASRDGSGSSGQIMTPQDKPGPSRMNQGPAERIRAPLGQPEPCRANQGRTSQGTETDRALKTKSTNWDRSGPCETNQNIIR